MDNEVVQRQLLLRAINSPYISTEVVGRDIGSLFKDNEFYQLLARTLVRYFSKTKEPITSEVLKSRLERQLEVKKKTGELDENQLINYFNQVDQLLDSDADQSTSMKTDLSAYVRKALGSSAILQQAQKAYKDSDYDLVGEVGKEMEEISTLDVSGQGSKVLSVFEDFEQKNELYKDLAKDKIKMGMKSMDMALTGGLAKGEVGLIAARSGFGKSSTLSAFSVSYAKHGHNVLHVSLEELPAQMLLRFDRILLGVTPSQILNKGKVSSEFEIKSAQVYKKLNSHGLGKLLFYRTSPQTLTIDHLDQIIKSVERTRGIKLDVVTLDYPDLLLNPNETGNEAEDGGKIYQQLRKMAQDNDVLLWTATQLNRMSGQQETMTLDSVEGSYRKINTVEFAATLNRTDAEYQNGFLRLHIDKLRNRNEFTGDTLYFKFDFKTMRLTDETDEEQQEHQSLLGNGESSGKAQRKKKYGTTDKVEETKKKADMFNHFDGTLPS